MEPMVGVKLEIAMILGERTVRKVVQGASEEVRRRLEVEEEEEVLGRIEVDGDPLLDGRVSERRGSDLLRKEAELREAEEQ